MVIHQKSRTIFAPSTLFLVCESYTWHMPSVAISDQCLVEIVQYEVCKSKRSDLFWTNQSGLRASQITRNIMALKGRLKQTVAVCDSAQKSCKRDELFQILGYDCLISLHRTYSGEGLPRREVQIKVPHRNELKAKR